jgi:hypothetical protein
VLLPRAAEGLHTALLYSVSQLCALAIHITPPCIHDPVLAEDILHSGVGSGQANIHWGLVIGPSSNSVWPLTATHGYWLATKVGTEKKHAGPSARIAQINPKKSRPSCRTELDSEQLLANVPSDISAGLYQRSSFQNNLSRAAQNSLINHLRTE